METALQYLYQDIETNCYYLNPPKAIKIASDFYNYLSALHKENIYFVNNHDYPLTYFMGIKLVVDDTIDNFYEFEH
jgi:hypothetical protein